MSKSTTPPASFDVSRNASQFLDRSALLCAIELEIPLHQVVGSGYAAPDPRSASRDSMAHPTYRRFLAATRTAPRMRSTS